MMTAGEPGATSGAFETSEEEKMKRNEVDLLMEGKRPVQTKRWPWDIWSAGSGTRMRRTPTNRKYAWLLGCAFWILLPQPCSGQWVYERLRSCGSAERNAANPYSGLIEADDGALYGTTLQGGSAGRGTVYKVNKDGSGYVIIRSFSGTGGDGSRPQASLIQGSDGALYGTTGNGGNAEDYTGAGTIFKISKDGTAYGILHKFGSVTNDGRSASGGLIEGTDGYLYGTTDTGGFSDSVFPPGYGTVFKIKKDGTGYGVVHQFIPSGGDGQRPYCSLLEASDGTLYGSTAQGGDAGPWYGTVFKLNKDGSGHTIFHSFGVSAGDGTSPTGGLI